MASSSSSSEPRISVTAEETGEAPTFDQAPQPFRQLVLDGFVGNVVGDVLCLFGRLLLEPLSRLARLPAGQLRHTLGGEGERDQRRPDTGDPGRALHMLGRRWRRLPGHLEGIAGYLAVSGMCFSSSESLVTAAQ